MAARPRIAALLLLAAAEPGPLAPGPHEVTVNGVRLWYRVAGGEGGEPVVFLHGGPGEGSNAFARHAGPALERRGLRMVYLDQRGSGRSERPASGLYSQPLLVDDLEQLRRTLGVARMALIGHSYGTVIGMEYAARHPRHVSRLVLSGAVPDVPAMLTAQCRRLRRQDPGAYGARPSWSRPARTRHAARSAPIAARSGSAGSTPICSPTQRPASWSRRPTARMATPTRAS